MKRYSSKSFIILLVAIFFVMSMPKKASEGLRGVLFATMAPIWETAQNLVSGTDQLEVELQRLQSEIQLLHNQLEQWQELYRNEHLLNIQLSQTHDNPTVFIHGETLKPQLEAIPAKVIFRSPGAWSSALWINMGSSDNKNLGKTVIAKNSPVVVANSIVGIIDYVGKNQSRVKLITDSSLAPSVRVVRGQVQETRILELLTLLQQEVEGTALGDELENYKKQITLGMSDLPLAKGELRGSSPPLWRSQNQLLKGIGFNYDFADQYGPARDLRTGEAQEEDLPPCSIIEEKDLLLTTGMDGVFPPGFLVGRVTKIHMLKEGDYYYELEAYPTAGNLNELTTVFVLAPVGYDPSDQPSRI